MVINVKKGEPTLHFTSYCYANEHLKPAKIRALLVLCYLQNLDMDLKFTKSHSRLWYNIFILTGGVLKLLVP